MKRIEFIAPIEAMRGDLSGGEKNTYKGGQQAYEAATTGIINAENYSKRYVGSKRSLNGKKSFALRVKSSVNMTESRFPMACLGGAASLGYYASHDLAVLSDLSAVYKSEGSYAGTGKAFRGWVTSKVYPMIKNKQASVTISNGTQSATINNPWVSGGSGTDVTIPAEVVTKFQSELAVGA